MGSAQCPTTNLEGSRCPTPRAVAKHRVQGPLVRRLLKDEGAQAYIEYIILCFILVVMLAALYTPLLVAVRGHYRKVTHLLSLPVP